MHQLGAESTEAFEGARDRVAAWTVVPLLGLLVCAGSLGDVFLEIPTAVALGLAVRFHLDRREAAGTTESGEDAERAALVLRATSPRSRE